MYSNIPNVQVVLSTFQEDSLYINKQDFRNTTYFLAYEYEFKMIFRIGVLNIEATFYLFFANKKKLKMKTSLSFTQ